MLKNKNNRPSSVSKKEAKLVQAKETVASMLKDKWDKTEIILEVMSKGLRVGTARRIYNSVVNNRKRHKSSV